MGLEYIMLAPGFVREVLEVYERWEGREGVPLKIQELMMVLQIEVDRYKPVSLPKDAPTVKARRTVDAKLG